MGWKFPPASLHVMLPGLHVVLPLCSTNITATFVAVRAHSLLRIALFVLPLRACAYIMNKFARRVVSRICRQTCSGLERVGALTAAGGCALMFSSLWSSAEECERDQTPRGTWGLDRPAVPASRKDNAVLLVSDLDGTLVGDDRALRKFNWTWLSQYQPRGSILVYSTARDKASYMDLLHGNESGKPHLLRPDFLILSEGTEIWHFPPGSDEPILDQNWCAHLQTNWDRRFVKKECAKLSQSSLIHDWEQDDEFREVVLLAGGFVVAFVKRDMCKEV